MTSLRLTLLLLASCLVASCSPITGLVSTGLGTTGQPDPDWVLSGGTAYKTQDGVFPFGAWSANTAQSGWISPRPTYSGLLSDPQNTDFIYALTFDLTGYLPLTATFSYRLAVDNSVTSVTLNGVAIPGIGGGSGFALYGPYTVGTGSRAFLPGINTLQVTTRNGAGTSGNPNGLRFEVTGSDVELASLPEPGTLFLAAISLAVIGAARRGRPARD